MYPGYFISFEGIDGAGKSTHLEAFQQLMKERYSDREVVMTREPGGTPLGEQLRTLLLDAPMNLATTLFPYTMLFRSKSTVGRASCRERGIRTDDCS